MFEDSTTGYLYLEGCHTKNGKAAKQYIPLNLVKDIQGLLADKNDAAKIFLMPFASNVVRMLRDDLSDARTAWLKDVKEDLTLFEKREATDFLKYEDSAGKKLDFHSLRHACGAYLVSNRVDIKTVQSIMRHSTPTLTLNTYGHLMPNQEVAAINTLANQFSAQQTCC